MECIPIVSTANHPAEEPPMRTFFRLICSLAVATCLFAGCEPKLTEEDLEGIVYSPVSLGFKVAGDTSVNYMGYGLKG